MVHGISLAEQSYRQMKTYQKFLADLRLQGFATDSQFVQNTLKHIKNYRETWRAATKEG